MIPVTRIKKEKIQPLPFLVNKIAEKTSHASIPSHALLIGAGCSISCKIPLGCTLIELCKLHSFILRNIPNATQLLDSLNDKFDCGEILQKLEEKDLMPVYYSYLNESEKQLNQVLQTERTIHEQYIRHILNDSELNWEEYEPFVFKDRQYGFWFDRYAEDPRERQMFIEQIIDNHPPSGAYIFLSYLIEKGFFSNILTTNFDDLINEALTYYTDIRCRFYADDEISQYISTHSIKPNIIKLHGDYRFANIKNTLEETDQLSNNVRSKLAEILGELGLIVVGYNGSDHSIMSVLYEIKKKHRFSLLWCGRDPDKVHWRVAHLINNTPNSYFVRIESFDALIGQLAAVFLSEPPGDLLEKANQKMVQVRQFLEQFKISFRKTEASDSAKEKLEQTIDKWEILKKANESTIDDQKFKWYSQFIALDNTNAVAFKNRGFIYRKFNQFSEAIADYTRAIELTMDEKLQTIIFSLRAEVYLDLRDYESARSDCDNAIALDPNYMYAYNNRGFALLFLKRYSDAINDFLHALQLDAEYKNPHCHLCVAYAKAGDYDSAMRHVTKALELAPFYGRAFFNRAKLYYILAEPLLAEADLAKAKEILSVEAYREQERIWN